MALVLVNQGEEVALNALLNKTAPQDLRLKLYTSNTTPAETDTEGTYTEASGSGYAFQNLTAASWTTTPGAPTNSTYPEHTWTFSGALGNVYGYFIIQQTSGKALWSERFSDGPYNIQNNGDQIKLTLNISAD